MTDKSQTDKSQTDLFTQAQSAVAHIRTRTPLIPAVGIILGSGLGNFASRVENPTTIAYADIPNFPQSTVIGHSGQLVLGHIAATPVAVMQGRVHAYEGYPLAAVTFPTRVLGLLGCRHLIVTNAAGGINTGYRQGQLVLISDHINLTGTNAALGPNEPRFALTPTDGQRFFDMSTAYTSRLRELALKEARKQGLHLEQGVYLAVLGPSFETPAEIRAFRTLGADLVGMSTVHEVIVARHMGLEVLGLSVVTNMAAGAVSKGAQVVSQGAQAVSKGAPAVSKGAPALPQAINHEEVIETGRQVEQQLTSLLTALIPRIPI